MWQKRENCDRNEIIVTGKMKLWKFVGCLWSGKFVDFVGWNIIIGGQQSLWKCHNLGFWYFEMKKWKCGKWYVATLESDVENEFWIAANAFKYS